ncbi:MAG: hypothetical protein SVS85_02615 [Candidatus Nanohaloarchaea archaeon]|nr:hypothetical protein [Candidatus Nanohaloarchaea archaeon]
MKKFASLSTLLGTLAASVSAAHQNGSSADPSWGFLLFSVVILAALAIFIYLRVQETGLLTFLPQTAIERVEED